MHVQVHCKLLPWHRCRHDGRFGSTTSLSLLCLDTASPPCLHVKVWCPRGSKGCSGHKAQGGEPGEVSSPNHHLMAIWCSLESIGLGPGLEMGQQKLECNYRDVTEHLHVVHLKSPGRIFRTNFVRQFAFVKVFNPYAPQIDDLNYLPATVNSHEASKKRAYENRFCQ